MVTDQTIIIKIKDPDLQENLKCMQANHTEVQAKVAEWQNE